MDKPTFPRLVNLKWCVPQPGLEDIIIIYQVHAALLQASGCVHLQQSPVPCDDAKYSNGGAAVLPCAATCRYADNDCDAHQMTLSDGSVRTFEVPLERFHEFRYNTAKVGAYPTYSRPPLFLNEFVAQALREISELETHPMLRIAGK